MSKNLEIHLLAIDPQNDFMDIAGAALPVPGANEDMERLAAFVDRVGGKLADIHVTLDSHSRVDITHPIWWVDSNGNNPAPFTIITVDDVKNGIWLARFEPLRQRSLAYVEALAAKGNYPLCIWPYHCQVGNWGHNVQPDLAGALDRWAEKQFAMVEFLTKGGNPYTEHYGALKAEVPDNNDPSTMLNTKILKTLAKADIVLVAGEALSHCVKATVTQIADEIGEEHIKKFCILTDCTSSVAAVPGVDFPAIGQAFLKDMEKRGMKLSTSVDFMKEG